MPGPTPLLVTHRLGLQIGVPGIRAHNLRLLCNAVVDGGDPDGFAFIGISSNVAMSSAVTTIHTLLLPMYNTTVSIGAYTLERYDSGSWTPVATDPLNGTATGSAATAPASQITVTGRNSDGERGRLQLMESIYPAPVRWTSIPAISTPLEPLVLTLFSNASTDLGFWVRYRNSMFFGQSSFISTVVSLNKRLRRDRGLA